MAKLRYRAIAQADLAGIDSFSAGQFVDEVADAYAKGLAEAFSRIALYPHSALARKDYGPRIRSAIYRRHRIHYVIDDKCDVEIYRVIHHSRDVRAALEL